MVVRGRRVMGTARAGRTGTDAAGVVSVPGGGMPGSWARRGGAAVIAWPRRVFCVAGWGISGRDDRPGGVCRVGGAGNGAPLRLPSRGLAA